MMKTNKTTYRSFGIFFLLAFLSYGIGTGLTTSVTEAADTFSNFSGYKTSLIVGVILMALVHTVVNIGLPVLMMPILKSFNKVLTYGYLSAGIAATVVLVVGALLLLLHIPLASMYINADASEITQLEMISTLLTKGNFYAYQIGMAIWGFGGLMFCYLLYISKRVPRGFSIWGFLGYIIFIAGTISELFGLGIGVLLAIPGGLFEITLIIRGFKEAELRTS